VSEGRRPWTGGVNPTLAVSALACAVVAIASLVSVPLLHWADRGTGAVAPALQERIYFAFPKTASNGVGIGTPIEFDIVLSSDAVVHWWTSDAGSSTRRSSLSGPPGVAEVLFASTSSATPDTWYSIHVTGIATPLRVWVT
jgi:hypothetical protein